MKKFLLTLIVSIIYFSHSFAQQDEYERLKTKIEDEEGEPHSDGSVSKDFEEYIYWLGVKATDRDLARDLASKYSMEGNPYWEERFLNLVELAQDSGESTLWMADYIFLRIKTKRGGIAGDSWQDAVFKADYYGKRLYQRAAELSFDADYIRESVRCLMRFALADVEVGGVALYYGREMEHGTQYDSEGNLLMPDMDFNILCLPRSAFHMVSEGEQLAPVDEGLSWVEEIREICEWFKLFEYNEGTDLMNQFLQDFLCDDKDNSDKNLHWYLSLAQKYKLEKSEQHILGFYGTLYGKVEIQEGEQVRNAPEARVQINDETNSLRTQADGTGNYTLQKAPLHCKCPPVPISAEFEGDRVDSKYQGKLLEPDPKSRQKKDLMIMGSGYAWSGNINIEITDRFYCMEEEETSELGRREVRANDEIRTLADISVGLEDFDFAGQSTNAGSMLRYASGNLTLNLREDHWTKGYAEKTQCHNENSGKWEWKSPGNWSTRHTTKSAIGYRDIKTENLIMLIMKDVGVDQTSMENLQKQLQEAAQRMDMKAIESLKGEMMNMVQGDKNSNTFPVRIQVQLTFPGNITDLVSTTYASESNDVCNSDNTKRDSSSDAGEVNIVAPVTVMMEGSYTRGDDGNDIINASVNLSEQIQAGFFSNICPDKTVSLKANIQLKRKHE